MQDLEESEIVADVEGYAVGPFGDGDMAHLDLFEHAARTEWKVFQLVGIARYQRVMRSMIAQIQYKFSLGSIEVF